MSYVDMYIILTDTRYCVCRSVSYRREASALLVQLRWAMREPPIVERATDKVLTLFYANSFTNGSRGVQINMYVTAILMLLLLVSLLVSESNNYKGLCPFDKATTLPLRGLLALLILSHHLGQRTDIYPISQLTSGIGLQIVAVFFFISGYGLCISYVAKGRNYMNGFLQKRLGKLLPKFLLLTIGMMLGYQFYSSSDIGVQIVKITSGWTPLPHSWFIYAIIYVYVIFYLCALFAKSPKQIGCSFTLAIVAYIGFSSKIIHFPSYWYLTIISVPLGYFTALYEKKIDSLIRYRFVFYASLIALLFISFCAMAKIQVPKVSLALTEIWILVQAFSVYAIIRTLGFLRWKWLCDIGVFSLELYLIHGIPLMIGQHIGLGNWFLWLFTYAVSIPLALLLNRVYDMVIHPKKILKA